MPVKNKLGDQGEDQIGPSDQSKISHCSSGLAWLRIVSSAIQALSSLGLQRRISWPVAL